MMIEVIAKWQAAEEAWKTDVEGTETSDVTECRKPPTEIHSHPKVPCRERVARQGASMWRGRGEEENGGQGT